MSISTIVPKRLITGLVPREWKIPLKVGFLLIRNVGSVDVTIWFDNNDVNDGFLVPRDVLMPTINVNDNIFRFKSILPGQLSLLTLG